MLWEMGVMIELKKNNLKKTLWLSLVKADKIMWVWHDTWTLLCLVHASTTSSQLFSHSTSHLINEHIHCEKLEEKDWKRINS